MIIKFPTTVSIKPGTIWNVEFSTLSTNQQITTGTAFLASAVTAGGTCDYNNVLKEIHYTAYVSSFSTISSIEADVVYASFKS